MTITNHPSEDVPKVGLTRHARVVRPDTHAWSDQTRMSGRTRHACLVEGCEGVYLINYISTT